MLSKVDWTTTRRITVTRIQKTSYDDKKSEQPKGLNGLKSRAEDTLQEKFVGMAHAK